LNRKKENQRAGEKNCLEACRPVAYFIYQFAKTAPAHFFRRTTERQHLLESAAEGGDRFSRAPA
jgi:hypothetical protein